jgi:hypothetical protein
MSIKTKKVRYDGKDAVVADYNRVDAIRATLDAVDSNLSIFFQRQLEFIEPEIHTVDYGELKSWKCLPIESRGGDNVFYTWRLYDKVGTWKIGGDDAEDIPEVNINGAELPVPIRWLTGGFKYNLKELLNGLQAARNNPNAPSIMVEAQKAQADFEAYQQIVDQIAWFANPSSPNYAGLTGIFYNPYIPTVACPAGASHTTWFSAAGVPQKTPTEVIYDLDKLVTTIRVNTLDRYSADTVLMPIEHFNFIATTPYSQYDPRSILKVWLGNHPEISMVDTLVNAKSVPAGGNITAATDIILAYKRDPSVVKLVIPKQHTMLPVQIRGFNYIIPCYAATAGVITQKPNAMAMMTGTSNGAVGS